MALTEDQRALLQLLLDGGQSYADIGSLLGIDQSEVRTRARRALTEIGGADPDSRVGLTDYLLGQADPIGRADAARHLQNDPATSALAARLAAQLRLLAPGARLPELPAAAAQAPEAAPASAASSASGSGSAPGKGARATAGARSAVERVGGAAAGLGARKRRLPVVLGVLGLVVLVGVLLATGVIGGSGDDNPSAATTATTDSAAGDVAVVPLTAQDGSKAGGQATFTVAQDQPVLQINLFGLKPNGPDDTYIVSLYRSDDETLPIARSNADKDGNLTGAAALPSQVGGTLGPKGFNQIDVSLATSSETEKALQTASINKQLPRRSGTSVLRGKIPAGAAAIASSAAGAATSTSTNPTSSTPTSTAP